ncbi:MAG: hypothetical protein GEV04_23735 [Actinophytocola sp.]|nr:hypothetical protein [Actinophytocola sp.]
MLPCAAVGSPLSVSVIVPVRNRRHLLRRALDALDRWLAWASRCRIDAFIALGRRIRAHYHPIAATLNCGLSNALAESINTKIRLIARRAFGFHNIDALIALANLTVSEHHPELPT